MWRESCNLMTVTGQNNSGAGARWIMVPAHPSDRPISPLAGEASDLYSEVKPRVQDDAARADAALQTAVKKQ
jgi:hypothetical protein